MYDDDKMRHQILLFVFLLSIFGIIGSFSESNANERKTIALVQQIGNGDFDRGLNHIVSLAKQGNSAATFLYANLFFETGNLEAFQKYLNLAANQGNPTAIKFLATSYLKGSFGKPDFQKAKAWFETGAGLRNINSMVYLGIIHRDALGTKPDPAEAYFWFTLAGKLKPDVPGQKEPEEFAEEIKHLLSKEETDSTEIRISQWLEKNPEVEATGIPPLE